MQSLLSTVGNGIEIAGRVTVDFARALIATIIQRL